MLKRDHISRKGNDRFQGFAVDLIDEIARMLDFEYEIYLVHDGNFGSKKSNGEWNGMIGELLAGVRTTQLINIMSYFPVRLDCFARPSDWSLTVLPLAHRASSFCCCQ